MGTIASQITSLTIVYSIVYSDADQRKDQSSASLAFVRGIHRWPVNSPHKWPVTRKMFPFDDVIMMGDIERHGRQTGRHWRCEWAHHISKNAILTSQYFIIKICIISKTNYHLLMMRDLIQVILRWHIFVMKGLTQPFAFMKGEWLQLSYELGCSHELGCRKCATWLLNRYVLFFSKTFHIQRNTAAAGTKCYKTM